MEERVCARAAVSERALPHAEVCSCRGFGALPSLAIGVLVRLKFDMVEVMLMRDSTCVIPVLLAESAVLDDVLPLLRCAICMPHEPVENA